MVYRDALFLIILVPLIDKLQQLMVYKIYNLPILIPPLLKQFKYNLPNDLIAISKDNLYITYPNSMRFSAVNYQHDITVKLTPHSIPRTVPIITFITYYRIT